MNEYVATALAVIVVVAAVLAVWVVRRRVPFTDLEVNHAAGSILHRSLGACFAVLLSFVIVTAWSNLTNAGSTVTRETTVLRTLYWSVSGFPSSLSGPIQQTIGDYAEAVADQEWPLMAHGEASSHAEALETRLWGEVLGLRPTSAEQEQLFGAQYQQVLAEMGDLDQSREERLQRAKPAIPPILWGLLIGGGAAVVLVTYLFATPRLLPQMLMTGAIAAFICCSLLFLSFLDHPYSGPVRLSPEPFQSVAEFARSGPGP